MRDLSCEDPAVTGKHHLAAPSEPGMVRALSACGGGAVTLEGFRSFIRHHIASIRHSTRPPCRPGFHRTSRSGRSTPMRADVNGADRNNRVLSAPSTELSHRT